MQSQPCSDLRCMLALFGQGGPMNEERELRIGIVGAGGIVKQRHLPGLRDLPGIKITAVANSSLESATRFCAEYAPEAKPYARWEEVVDNAAVDIVWVGATPYMHHDVADYGLHCGKHVFCQARMASTLAEAQGMWEAAISYPELVAAICPAPHGMKGGEVMKKLLADGAIGVPHQALLHSFNAGWLDPQSPIHWRQQMEISGIQILTLGIYVEVLHRWLGQINEMCLTSCMCWLVFAAAWRRPFFSVEWLLMHLETSCGSSAAKAR